MPVPYITAHSVCENTPQDSMASVEKALLLGADIVEMDVRKAPDGVLRISHDRLDQAGYADKLTLEAVISRILDTPLSLNCDLKEPSTLYDVLAMAERLGFARERLILSGCTSPEQLARDDSLVRRARVFLNIEEVLKILYLSERLPGYDTRFSELMTSPWRFLGSCLLTDERLDQIVLFAKTLGVEGINLPIRCLTDQLVETFRKSGTETSVWTVNDEEGLERCIRAGARNITTRTPGLALEKRRQLCRVSEMG